MSNHPSKYWEQAKQHRDRGQLEAAANSFTLAAHQRFADSNYVEPPFERSAPTVAFGLYSLLAAGVYYRASSNQSRSENRCRVGIIHCEELKDISVSYDAQKGMMWEYIGDFRTIADMGNQNVAYDKAKEHYKAVDNPIRWQAEPEFEMNMTFMLDIVDSIDWTIDRKKKHRISAESLLERIDYKSSEFPNILDSLYEQNE